MTVPNPPHPIGPHGSYHYIFTYLLEDQTGAQQQRIFSTSGLQTPGPSVTREELFRLISTGLSVDGATPIPLFFALEPNELPAARDLPG